MDDAFARSSSPVASSPVACAWRYSSSDPGGDPEQVAWWCSLTGQTLEERASQGWLDAILPDDRHAVDMAWQRALEKGEPYLAVFRVRTVLGEPHLLLAYALPATVDIDDRPSWTGQMIDITLYHRAAAHAERLTSLIADLGPGRPVEEIPGLVAEFLRDALAADAVAVLLPGEQETSSLDMGAALGFDSGALRQLLQMPVATAATTDGPLLDELSGIGFGGGMAAPLTGMVRGPGTIVVATRQPWRYSAVDAEFLDTVALHAGRAIQLTRALDAERAAWAETDRAHHQLRLVADAAPALIAYVDRSYAFQFSNATFIDWFNLGGEIGPGTSLATVVGPRIYEALLPGLQQALAGEPASLEMTLDDAGPSPRRIAYSFVPSVRARGEVQGLVILGTDVSERERAIERSDRLIELSAALSHVSSHDEMVDVVIRQAPAAVGATSVAIVLASAGQAMVWSGPWEDGEVHLDLTDVPPQAPVWLVMEWNRPVFVHVPSKNAAESSVLDLLPDAATPGIRVLLPMIVSFQPTGILVFAFPPGTGLTPSDLGFLQLLAGICAGAIDRASLHDSLQERESRFRSLADAVPQIVWVSSGDGLRLEYLNQRWEEFTGIPSGEVRSGETGSYLHPDDREESRRRWEHSVGTGELFEVEVRLRQRDGSYAWVLNRGVPIRGPGGKIETWFGTMTDIDSQKLALTHQGVIASLDTQVRLLSDPAQILQTLVTTIGRHLRVARCFLTEVVDIDHAPGGIVAGGPDIVVRALWVADDATDVAAIREEAPRLSSQFAEELRSGRIVVVEDLETGAPTERAREAAAILGVRSIVIVPYLRAGRWVAGITVHSSVPRVWTEPELSIIEAAVKRTWPLVERSRAVEALAESENRLRHAAEAANFSSFDFDPRTGAGFWSADIARVLRRKDGAETPTTLGQLADMVYPDDRQRLLDLIDSARDPNAGNVVIGEFRHESDDGEICWFLLRGSVQFSGTGKERVAERIRGVMMDITPRKREEEERLNALDAAAHDLKNPVATIRALAQVGMRGQKKSDSPDPQLMEILEGIETATGRLTNVIGDLLDTAHLRAGRSLPLHLERADLVQIVRDVCESWRETYPGLDLTDDYPAERIEGCWDEQRLVRVFDNLIGNAIKFSPGGGPVRVSVGMEPFAEREGVSVAIADRGIGIASTDLARVQETFERGSNVPDSIPGTGMGLMAAKLIAKQHGGMLRLESVEGQGTTATVWLPVAPCDGGL
ncbi:MAG: PAS domain-containing protein [Thermomicrobiales bacterium]|nr:PAS domain-containing protein [Thermomicrobiales bacterium]